MANLWSPLLATRETASAPGPVLRAWLLGEDYDSGKTVINGETAMGYAAYFACIRNISEDIAKLPIRVYRMRKDGGKDAIPDHPNITLLNESWNRYTSAMNGWEAYISHACGWAGGYAEIVRGDGGNGLPAELWPIDPQRVDVVTGDNARTVRYRVTRLNGLQEFIADDDILHLHGLGYSGLTGYLMWKLGKLTIGPALAANQFRLAFFENGATHSMVITVPDTWSDLATENFRKDLEARHAGARKAYSAMILEKGATATAASSDPDKSQLGQTLEFNVEDNCRLFRMPPNKVQRRGCLPIIPDAAE